MTQTQFLLFFIAAIPLVNCLLIKLCEESPILVNIINKASPVLFLVNLIGLYGSLKSDDSYLVIVEAMRGISLGFAVDEIAMGFLFLLNFFWLILTFYSQRFLFLSEAKNVDSLKLFFLLIISFVNLIIISKNLLSTLFFYNCLVLLCHFFAIKFVQKKDGNFLRLFTILLYLESVFFFLAIVATYKFTGQIDFVNGGVIAQNFDKIQHTFLLALYVGGLFLSILLPSYLLYRSINLDPLPIYILFFLAYGMSSLYIFVKLLNFVFGFKGFSLIVAQIGFGVFEAIFLLNLIAAAVCLAFSKGIKSSFFYLFFQQFLFALFATILFANFDGPKIYIAIFSFLFSLTLIFLCISNFVLYLGKAEDKSIAGLFHELTVTSILLIFGILNLAGIAPAIGGVEKFFLIKIIIQKKLWLSGIILLANFVTLALFSWKNLRPLFLAPITQKAAEPGKKAVNELAKDIDFDSNLILTALVVAIAMFFGLIFFPFVINFFEGL